MSQFLELRFHPVPVSKRSAKKSKGGCKACKLRKVKCDETHPVCGNCKTYFSNRVEKCDYGPLPEPRKAPIESLLPTDSRIITSKKARRITSLPPQRRTSHPKVPPTVGLMTLDPFNTQISSKLPRANLLLRHYLSAVICKCLPAGYKPENNPLSLGWWPLVRKDNLLFHMMLQVSAVDLEWQTGKPNSFSSVKYTRESTRLLRDRLQHPVQGISNETIGAVATLAALEYGWRNMMAMRTHIQGLKEMIALRGGYEKVRLSSPPAAAVAFWFSLVLTLEPQFPPEEPIGSHGPRQWPREMYASSQVSELLDFEEYGVPKEVSDILMEIRHLSRCFPTQSDGGSSPVVEGLYVHAEVCSLHGRLLQAKPSHDTDSQAGCITECCRLAASIFLFFPFENHYPDPTLLLNSLIHKLQTALSRIVPYSLGRNKLLAWLLSVGGVAASNLPAERDWFISHLAESVAELELKTWDDMRSRLQQVIWIDAIDESPFRQLWEEVLISATCLTTQDPFCAIRY